MKKKIGDLVNIGVVHKANFKSTYTYYIAFGQYGNAASPLCVGAKMMYKGNRYKLSLHWKHVTCKHCLKKRVKK